MPEKRIMIRQVNAVDTAVEVASITSNEAEQFKVLRLEIYLETNEGILRGWHQDTRDIEHITSRATIRNALVIGIDRELAIGKTFSITLQNYAAGVNAELYADLVYEKIG